MTDHLCATCGTLYPPSHTPPSSCPICEDERQYVPEDGQQWLDYRHFAGSHTLNWRDEADGVASIEIRPRFAIGQRAFFIEGAEGNILWDCLSLLDDATADRIEAKGGLAAIAISHPHYYSAMTQWGRRFNAPIYIHADDRQWAQRLDGDVRFWEGETFSIAGSTLIRCGGHFAGGVVLHCPQFGGSALFSGDILQVVPDRRHVSFMYSYPNLIPLDGQSVRAIVAKLEPYDFDVIYGAFAGRTIATDGKRAVDRSLERYLRAIGDL